MSTLLAGWNMGFSKSPACSVRCPLIGAGGFSYCALTETYRLGGWEHYPSLGDAFCATAVIVMLNAQSRVERRGVYRVWKAVSSQGDGAMNLETVRESCAFVELRTLSPYSQGTLSGLTFAVKDMIDVAGRRTGRGNPLWRDTHPPASVNAPVVDLLLAAGGRGVGITVTDELAASFAGENAWFGAPRNPAAPDCSPGGSSCGSASAVAHGLCDFALGTDTGGSVRVPASYCGLLGWRPTWGSVSACGVLPLAPGFDTVGVLARRASCMLDVAHELTGTLPRRGTFRRMVCLDDAFFLADREVVQAVEPGLARLESHWKVSRKSLADLTGPDVTMDLWAAVFNVIESAEVGATLGGWLRSAQPDLGPVVRRNLGDLFEVEDQGQRVMKAHYLSRAWSLRRVLVGALERALVDEDLLLCLPTAPSPPPLRGSWDDVDFARSSGERLLALGSIAGLGGFPQVSLPMGTTRKSADGLCARPVGLSIIGPPGSDLALVEEAVRLEREGTWDV